MHPDNHKPRKNHTKDDISIWVYRAVDLWTEVLQLENWKIDIRFDLREKKTFAAVDTEYAEYECAEISFNTRYIRKEGMKEENVSDMVLHELMHCRIAELAQSQTDLALQVEERTVQNLIRAIHRARQVGQQD
jgi:hypothetical protein